MMCGIKAFADEPEELSSPQNTHGERREQIPAGGLRTSICMLRHTYAPCNQINKCNKKKINIKPVTSHVVVK